MIPFFRYLTEFDSYLKCPCFDIILGYGILILQEPLFPQMVLRASDNEIVKSLKNSITDDGLCVTVNANSMIGTFNDTQSNDIKTFADILDGSVTNHTSAKVKGSGYLHRVEFWLNVRNSNPTASATISGNIAGHIKAAINNWNDHFSVRFELFFYTGIELIAKNPIIIDLRKY